jgi:hypothetical protein
MAKEGIAPGDFRRPSFAGGDDDIDAVKCVSDVSGDRGFVHSWLLMMMMCVLT